MQEYGLDITPCLKFITGISRTDILAMGFWIILSLNYKDHLRNEIVAKAVFPRSFIEIRISWLLLLHKLIGYINSSI